MRIAVGDNNNRKFIWDLLNHWEKKGHEVRFEMGASPSLAQWADLYYVDTFDNNIAYLYDLYHGDPRGQRPVGWDNDKKPIVVCRALDWEVWLGHADDQQIVDWIDKGICIAPHIEKRLKEKVNWGNKLKCIRPGVNLDKFTLKSKQTDGFQLGMVLGDMWWPKQHMMGLDIFHQLWKKDNRWRLHIRGQHEKGEYWKIMYDYYIESRGLQDAVILYPSIEDMNEFYEGIDILLHPGMKEGFCYAVGEAMAKGIPAVVNDFYGSKDIWPEWILYQNHEEAIAMIKKPWLDGDFIKDYYSLERQLKETDEYLGL